MTASEIVHAASPADTEACGEALAHRVEPGDVILLEGDLAVGKTTFVRGLLRGLGGDPSDANSPTFVVVQSYPCTGSVSALHHIDLYRLPDESEALREIGLDDFLGDESAVVAVEWPRPALRSFFGSGVPLWRVAFAREGDEIRRIEIFRQ
ncbi:MAG: tRNA (adenosine(37)-N6)-threonylcarbamoyltransferase complex ATPase subunit type 1 TsaE [Acidobacteria bacterium]|nr:tRNA (adenosine(37)-N6)-threonylcarbamoyltransferase complex ATPase subunit type 1 TsaE [Acidobacteriota bacterium]